MRSVISDALYNGRYIIEFISDARKSNIFLCRACALYKMSTPVREHAYIRLIQRDVFAPDLAEVLMLPFFSNKNRMNDRDPDFNFVLVVFFFPEENIK